jgi:hypothetical protein
MWVAAAFLHNDVRVIVIFLSVTQSEGVTRECLMSGVSEFSGGGWCQGARLRQLV